MRALVVDDEAPARRRLATLLEELGVEVVGEVADGAAALDVARETRPDVVFLDVAMPEVDGFDVARHLGDPRPLVVFQTAYPELALHAFEHEALDYVVKPVRRERLARAVERVARRLDAAATSPSWTPGDLHSLGAALGHAPSRPARLLVRSGRGHRLVPLREIELFRARGGLVHAHTADGSAATDYTLAELEARLGTAFLRASRSDLVAVAHVRAVRRGGDGSAVLTTTSGRDVHVSRRRAAAVRAALAG